MSDRWKALASRVLAGSGLLFLIAMMPWLGRQAPEYTVLRARYADRPATPDVLAQIRDELGLGDGPWASLGRWLGGLVRGDWGTSWVSGKPVLPGVLSAFHVSLSLMLWALVVALVVAAVCVIPTIRRGLNGQPRRSAGLLTATLISLPEFLLATVLLIVVAVWLRWLPPYGWASPQHVILPALALGLPGGGLLGQLLSDALADTMSEAWVQTWGLSGASRRRITLAALRRALPSVTGQVALIVIGLTGGAVAVEEIFAIPGLGRTMIGSTASQDIPALQACMVLLLLLAALCGVIAAGLQRLMLGAGLRTASLPAPAPRPPSSRLQRAIPLAAVGLLLAMVMAGLLRDPFATSYRRLQQPSMALPFGADAAGRDVLARVAHGTLTTVGLAVVVGLVCLLLGLGIGLLGAWSTGLVEVANAAPPIIVGVIVSSLMGSSALGAAIAVASVGWAPLAAHTHALVMETAAKPHIRIQPTWGVGRLRLLWGAILPEVAPVVARHALLRLPAFALALASLGFLGLGAQPPSPEWGLLLDEGAGYVERAPWAVLAPTAALALTAIAAVSSSAWERTS